MMPWMSCELAIVGGGPCGMAAAVQTASLGLDTILLAEQHVPLALDLVDHAVVLSLGCVALSGAPTDCGTAWTSDGRISVVSDIDDPPSLALALRHARALPLWLEMLRLSQTEAVPS